MARNSILQIRNNTEANWEDSTIVLAKGELAYTTDTYKVKIGDGVNLWSGLPYIAGSSTTGSSIQVSDTPPPTPLQGDLWYESDTGITYIYYDSYWIELGGVTGQDGISIGPTAPVNTDILWYDTTESGNAVVPLGGVTDQVLAKGSNSDYDLTWRTINFSDQNNILSTQVFG